MPPPRSLANPAPQTASARAALSAFYCSLCQKGYSRQNEYAAHESSYEHNHALRRKNLASMNRTMAGTVSSKKSGDDALVSMKPISLGTAEGKDKPGFKKSGFRNAFAKEEEPIKVNVKVETDEVQINAAESDEDESYEYYDPRRPTGCGLTCQAYSR